MNKCDSGEIVSTHCQRPRRGHYGPGADAHLIPQRDSVARLSYSVSSWSEDITQYKTSRLVDRPLSHVTVMCQVVPVAGPSPVRTLVSPEPFTEKLTSGT